MKNDWAAAAESECAEREGNEIHADWCMAGMPDYIENTCTCPTPNTTDTSVTTRTFTLTHTGNHTEKCWNRLLTAQEAFQSMLDSVESRYAERDVRGAIEYWWDYHHTYCSPK